MNNRSVLAQSGAAPASSNPQLALTALAAALILAGCETPAGGRAPASSGPSSAAPAVQYNLSGYAPAFKAGYADACATPRRRNEERFKSEADYSIGWNDGLSACRGR